MSAFEYQKPASLHEACSLRAEYGFSSRFLMGGTDLTVEMDQGLVAPRILIDLKGIEDLKEIREGNDEIIIGAGLTFTELIRSPLAARHLPSLVEAARTVASVGIRNVATLAGNICHAVPSADEAAPLLIRDTELTAASVDGERTISIHDFFQGPRRTSLLEKELITEIHIKKNTKAFGECYLKLGRYRGEDLAQVGVAVSVDEDFTYKIAYAAVAPVPLRISEAEELLRGGSPGPDKLEAAVEVIRSTVAPIDDIRSSRDYRLYMCGVLFEKAVHTALRRMEQSKTGGRP